MSLKELRATPSVEDVGPAGESKGWNEEASLGTGRREHASAADDAGLIYAIGGDDGTTRESASVEQYDPNTDTWTSVASLSTGRRRLAAVGDKNGDVYAIGGVTSSTLRSASVEEYDADTNSWTSVASLSTGRKNHAAANPDDGLVYAIGGNTDASFTSPDVERYDSDTNSWSSAPDLPTGRRGLAAAAVSFDIVIAGGVSANNDPTDVVEVINTFNDTTQTVSSLPKARTSLEAGLDNNGDIRFISGDTGSGRTNRVDVYDESQDNYSDGQPIPTARQLFGVASDNNDLIYAVGGATTNDSTSDSVEKLRYSPKFADVFTASKDSIVVLDDTDGVLKNKTTGRRSNPNVARDGETIQYISSKSSRVTQI